MVKEYTKRAAICMTGLTFCGLGSALGVLAGDVGTNAWNTLALGLQRLTAQSFGTCTFLVSLSIVVIDLLGRGKLGFGSLLNVIFVAFFSDFSCNRTHAVSFSSRIHAFNLLRRTFVDDQFHISVGFIGNTNFFGHLFCNFWCASFFPTTLGKIFPRVFLGPTFS